MSEYRGNASAAMIQVMKWIGIGILYIFAAVALWLIIKSLEFPRNEVNPENRAIFPQPAYMYPNAKEIKK